MRLQSFVLFAAFLAFAIAFPQDGQLSTFISVTVVKADPQDDPILHSSTSSFTVTTFIPASTMTSINPEHAAFSESIALGAPPTRTASQSSTTDGSSSTDIGVTSSLTSLSTSASITPAYIQSNQTTNGYANATATAGGQNNTEVDLGNGSGGHVSGGVFLGAITGGVGGIFLIIISVMVYCCCCRRRGSSYNYKTTPSVESIPLVTATKVTVPKEADTPEVVPLVSRSGNQTQSLPKAELPTNSTSQSHSRANSAQPTELPAPVATRRSPLNFIELTELPALAATAQPQVRFAEPTELPTPPPKPQPVPQQTSGSGQYPPPSNPYSYDPYNQSANMNKYFPPQQPCSYQPTHNPYQPPPHNPYNP